jgi:hypothetical protein
MWTWLRRLPGMYRLEELVRQMDVARQSARSPYLRFAPAGHYYSPLPDHDYVLANHSLVDRSRTTLPGIDLRQEEQRRLLGELARFHAELPFPDLPQEGLRYYYRNDFFSYGDAIALYGILRRFQPARVIEVGSGFSSALMLDTRDRFLERPVRFTFIEPYPERLLGLLTEQDRSSVEIIQDAVQEVPLERFDELEANDVLFIDSSHVLKVGSDVMHLVFSVLPRLKPGVLVHFHDIFWPFEYPFEWFLEGRAWNEAYFLRVFLQFNHHFEILYFGHYLAQHHPRALAENLPLSVENPGGSLWIRRALAVE